MMSARSDDDAEVEAVPDIRFACEIFDVAFHPQHDVVAVGLVSGVLELYVTRSSYQQDRLLSDAAALASLQHSVFSINTTHAPFV